jgi:hypothetical protein
VLILDSELTVCGADSGLVELICQDNTYPNPARAEAEHHGRPYHHLPRSIQTYREVAEGLDISRWAALVLATPISSRVRLLQAVGRVIRPKAGKGSALIVDLADDHGLSGSSLKKRLEIYRERGYPVDRIENIAREALA